jgi:hypothetical protein
MVDVTFTNRTQACSFDCGNRNGSASEGDKLHFVGHTAFVDVDDRAYVTSLQILCGQVVRQYHAIMFFDFHLASKGYAVSHGVATGNIPR